MHPTTDRTVMFDESAEKSIDYSRSPHLRPYSNAVTKESDMARARILVVDDEKPIADIIAMNLKEVGYDVHVADNGEIALEMARELGPDLIVLDVMLPGAVDGFEVCRRVRENASTPIIFLSARTHEADVIEALALGGDSYVKKPFDIAELVALVKATLRRTLEYPFPHADVLTVQDIEIDIPRVEVRVGTRVIPVSATEFRLLEYLGRHADRTVSRHDLLEHVWGFKVEGVTTRTVDMTVARLRKKLAGESEPRYIHTVPGIGYRLDS